MDLRAAPGGSKPIPTDRHSSTVLPLLPLLRLKPLLLPPLLPLPPLLLALLLSPPLLLPLASVAIAAVPSPLLPPPLPLHCCRCDRRCHCCRETQIPLARDLGLRWLLLSPLNRLRGASADLWALDCSGGSPALWNWTEEAPPAGPSPPPRSSHAAAITGAGTSAALIVCGGQDGSRGSAAAGILSDAWVLAPLGSASRHWHCLDWSGKFPLQRCRHSLAVVNGLAIVYGGYDGVCTIDAHHSLCSAARPAGRRRRGCRGSGCRGSGGGAPSAWGAAAGAVGCGAASDRG